MLTSLSRILDVAHCQRRSQSECGSSDGVVGMVVAAAPHS